jgi:diketogulonate reductase-like aldo/keto reductase
MSLNINSKIKLNSGTEIPVFGLGTYKLTGERQVKESVLAALEEGYRLIDTAQMYQNEEYVGQAIRESSIPRKEIFVTTKLDNDQHGYDRAKMSFDESLNRLKSGYVDLFLIHWPVEGLRMESWRALVDIYDQGGAKAIGVSNYTIRHIKELLAESQTRPAVNQVEFNPFNYQDNLLSFCNEEGIRMEGYTPLSRGHKFRNSIVREMSEKYSKTPPQILLRWAVQHSVIPVPKSSHKKRIKENADIFDFNLTGEDMEKLNGVNENYRLAMDPHKIK